MAMRSTPKICWRLAAAGSIVLLAGACTTQHAGTAVVAPTTATAVVRATPTRAPSNPAGTGQGPGPTLPSSVPALPPGATIAPPPTSGPADKGKGWLWTQTALTPLGQPVAVGRNVVLYGELAGVLFIEVADAATGRLLWSAPASPGAGAPGVNLHPTIIDNEVIYLRPSATSIFAVHVVAADPTTGKTLAVSRGPNLQIVDRLRPCADQVCFTARSTSASSGLRMDIHTGAISIDPARAGQNSRPIGGAGLISIHNPSTPEQLARQSGDALLWNKPLDGVFGPGYGTDYGWNFRTYNHDRLAIGTVGKIPAAGLNQTVFHLGKDAEMVGIDLATGTRTWKQTGGIDYDCLPDQAVTDGGALVLVRCRWGATTTITANRAKKTDVLSLASVSLERFNPHTGATTWTVPLANPTGSSYETWAESLRISGEQTLLADGPAGQITINPVTGKTAPATSTTPVVCSAPITTAIAGANTTINNTVQDFYVTGESLHTCTTTGQPTAPTAAWPSWAGTIAGHTHIIVTPAGLQGYQQ